MSISRARRLAAKEKRAERGIQPPAVSAAIKAAAQGVTTERVRSEAKTEPPPSHEPPDAPDKDWTLSVLLTRAAQVTEVAALGRRDGEFRMFAKADALKDFGITDELGELVIAEIMAKAKPYLEESMRNDAVQLAQIGTEILALAPAVPDAGSRYVSIPPELLHKLAVAVGNVEGWIEKWYAGKAREGEGADARE